MLKKLSLLILSVIMILTILPTQTLASNHGDTNYSFTLTTNSSVTTKERAKNNTTSTYVRLDSVPGSAVLISVEGFRPTGSGGTNVWMNETVGGTQVAKPGQWLVRQNVYERGGRSARLRFQRYSTSGTVNGAWSPDSVGTYPRLN